MSRPHNFDVLIVYSEKLARSSSNLSAKVTTPFRLGSSAESYNIVYGYFLKTCHQFRLKAAFTTSADIIGPGLCQSYWKFSSNKWHKINSPCFSNLIFDKFSPTRQHIKTNRQLLFSSSKVKPFNDPALFDLFFDKQKTYDKLSQHSIPTIALENKTVESIKKTCQQLASIVSLHPGFNDFGSDIIIKDRFGAGGRRVHKFSSNQPEKIYKCINRNSHISYIIQPFAIFDKGFCYLDNFAATDIRLVYLKGEIIQSYIRVAKSGEFRCNEHQGGILTYIDIGKVPKSLIAKSNQIAKTLRNTSSLFSLDFIISNNGNPYLLEGNTGPGLDWNMSLKTNEIEAKKLINLVVKELYSRANKFA